VTALNNKTYNKAEQFFNRIKEHCSNNDEYIIELLKARGFLLDVDSGSITISDNSYWSDVCYLNEVILNYGLGELNGNVLTIYANADTKAYENYFAEGIQIGATYDASGWGWRWFRNRIHGKKCPVKMLEHFIARYIKAISACGVCTVCSCDGNHKSMHKAHFLVDDPGSLVWHKSMWVNCLSRLFEINWDEDYLAFNFLEKDRYSTYYEINRAAAFIYDHRLEFRQIKSKAFWDISASFLKHADDSEIEERFYGNVSVLLKDWAKNIQVE